MDEKSAKTSATQGKASRAAVIGKALTQLLHQVLRDAGWSVDGPEASERTSGTFFLTKRKHRYAAVLNAAVDSRRTVLQGYLADAALRAREAAAGVGRRPLAVVGAPLLSDNQRTTLRTYAQNYLGNTAYGLVDQTGRAEFTGPGLPEAISAASALAPLRGKRTQPGASNPFSDSNQWLLKVLLAPRLPNTLIRAPYALAKNSHHLAKLARVSPATAHRFVRLFEKLGFLATKGGPLRLVDEERLLRAWCSALVTPPPEYRLQWLLPQDDGDAQLRQTLTKLRLPGPNHKPSRTCLALYAASTRLGWGHTHGISPHVYIERSLTESPSLIGTIEAEPLAKADLYLRRPLFPKSVFRAAVTAQGELCTDVIQTWLDTNGHSARGQEQADFLWRRVICPLIVKGKRSE
jgi:hypothetical protein